MKLILAILTLLLLIMGAQAYYNYATREGRAAETRIRQPEPDPRNYATAAEFTAAQEKYWQENGTEIEKSLNRWNYIKGEIKHRGN